MRTKFILPLLGIITVVSCASVEGLNLLPTLVQPKYFSNDSVEWFPEIIGGTPIQLLAEMNGLVSIQNRYGYHLCSGVLVSYKLVLTTASCLFNQDGEQLDTSEIRVIADDTLITGDGSATRQIQEIETFNFTETGQGLAIIELLNPFIETDTLNFSTVSNDTESEDQTCQVFGWGVTMQNSKILLHKIDVQIISNDVANSSEYYTNKMPSGTIAVTTLDNSNSCFSDLGSVLICDGSINGFLSFGYGCSRTDFPTIFYGTYDVDFITENGARMLRKLGISKPSITKPIKYPTYYPGGSIQGGTGATNIIKPSLMLFILLCTSLFGFNRFVKRF